MKLTHTRLRSGRVLMVELAPSQHIIGFSELSMGTA